MPTVTIILPLPAKELSPNARCHWRKKAKFVQSARQLAEFECHAQIRYQGYERDWRKARVTATFYHMTNRGRDAANCEASLKAYFDGIVDAGLIVDDNHKVLSHGETRFEIDKEYPRVELMFERLDGLTSPNAAGEKRRQEGSDGDGDGDHSID